MGTGPSTGRTTPPISRPAPGRRFAFQPDLDARKVRDLATLDFIDKRSNIALLGPPGVGKTMIAVALAVAAGQAGYPIYFTSLDDLVRRLRAAEATGRFNRQLAGQASSRSRVGAGRPPRYAVPRLRPPERVSEASVRHHLSGAGVNPRSCSKCRV
ncbi:MAG: ATP-binding protein [Geodermatophilaceae bacterium]|nr:ATP-binding protein [Geodermatophilaceae bacterium]